MAIIDQNEGAAEAPKACPSVKDLLASVTAELAKFEAKKLGELKAELDAFVKQQDALVAGYRTKYPVLRKLWCDRQLDVERLCAHIGCEFPLSSDKVKKIIEDCICKPLHDNCCREQRVLARKKCCFGSNQWKREMAQIKFDAAKRKLDATTGLAAKIEAILADNLKLVGEIEKVSPSERPVVLYLWLKLLRSHKHVAPPDASPACKAVCKDWDLNGLCDKINKEKCPEDNGGCKPEYDHNPVDCTKISDPEGPNLIHPDDYQKALDCAWDEYHAAKQALAEAEAELKKNPDDLDSLVKALAEDTKGLEDRIRTCLKGEAKPKDDCCKGTEPKKEGANYA